MAATQQQSRIPTRGAAGARKPLGALTSAFNCAAPVLESSKKASTHLPVQSPSQLRVVDLREELKEMDQPTAGLKADLVERVRQARQVSCASPQPCAAPVARLRRAGSRSPPESQPPSRTCTSELLATKDPFKRSSKMNRTPPGGVAMAPESPQLMTTISSASEAAIEPATPSPVAKSTEKDAAPDAAPDGKDLSGTESLATVESIYTSADAAAVAAESEAGAATSWLMTFVNAVAVVSALLAGVALVADSTLVLPASVLAEVYAQVEQAVEPYELTATFDAGVNGAVAAAESAALLAADAHAGVLPSLEHASAAVSTGCDATAAAITAQWTAASTLVGEQVQAASAAVELQMNAGSRVSGLEAEVAALKLAAQVLAAQPKL